MSQISMVNNEDGIAALFDRAEELGVKFDRAWSMEMWRGILSNSLGAIFYQHEGDTVIGAMGLTVGIVSDGEYEAREIFWFGGDLQLLGAAELWAKKIGAARILIGRPEGDRSGALDRIRERGGYEMFEVLYRKEL